EHRQQVLDQPLVGARDQGLLVTRDPLAVVLELRRQTLEVVEVLDALRLRLVGGGAERFALLLERLQPLLQLCLRRSRHYEVFASSSPTPSASWTPSSSSLGAPLPPPAWDACAWACACA